MKPASLAIAVPAPERLAALVQNSSPAFWLDSASRDPSRSRRSILALDPSVHRHCRDFKSFHQFAREADPSLAVGSQALDSMFGGGWIGCLSYEGQGDFFLYETWLEIDHARAQATVFSLAGPAKAEELAARLAGSAPKLERWKSEPPLPALTRGKYLEQVREIQERLQRGDCYQVNLSQGFSARGHGDPADLYLRLRQSAPAPQMAFVNLGDQQIFSASPEILLETEGSRARSYPIKGTRPRSADPVEDRRLAEELLASPKDAAELLMIVDLVRNDLGAVSRSASVKVPDLKILDSLAQVHHLYAVVESELKEGLGPLEAIWRLSPGGSITGAPKLKAMEVIAELEGRPRGIYTGSIGYAGFAGRSCFNIAIRTAVLKEGNVDYRAGGGIVVDSDPEAEYAECFHKARGFFAALGAEPDRD